MRETSILLYFNTDFIHITEKYCPVGLPNQNLDSQV